ncbi:hypothetical protein CR513_02105, partial [Mucuna pruriens]
MTSRGCSMGSQDSLLDSARNVSLSDRSSLVRHVTCQLRLSTTLIRRSRSATWPTTKPAKKGNFSYKNWRSCAWKHRELPDIQGEVELKDEASNRIFQVNGHQLKHFHEGPKLIVRETPRFHVVFCRVCADSDSVYARYIRIPSLLPVLFLFTVFRSETESIQLHCICLYLAETESDKSLSRLFRPNLCRARVGIFHSRVLFPLMPLPHTYCGSYSQDNSNAPLTPHPKVRVFTSFSSTIRHGK